MRFVGGRRGFTHISHNFEYNARLIFPLSLLVYTYIQHPFPGAQMLTKYCAKESRVIGCNQTSPTRGLNMRIVFSTQRGRQRLGQFFCPVTNQQTNTQTNKQTKH